MHKKLTFDPAAMAKLPPRRRMTFHAIFDWTTFQDRRGGTGPGSELSVNIN